MKRIFSYLLVLVGLASCIKKSGELPKIRLDNISAIDLKHEIPLDSVVERTEIIRIASDTAFIIGRIKMVFESKDNFFLIADNRIVRLNKNGKLLNIIGKQGKGPGEYISPWTLDVDETNYLIYVMDYFGRKMLRYRFDGSFDKKIDLPDNYAVNGFKLYQGKILYTSQINSVSPEMYIYDQNTDELLEISSADRQMNAGEAFMGTNFLMGNKEHPLLFHYFNDTVFSIVDNQLKPEYLLIFGKLKIQ